jgi:hypothetical protein
METGGTESVLESLRKSLEGLGKAMDSLVGTMEQNICKIDDMSFKLRELGEEKVANGKELIKAM